MLPPTTSAIAAIAPVITHPILRRERDGGTLMLGGASATAGLTCAGAGTTSVVDSGGADAGGADE
jgi:hypothetical protein